MKNLVKLLLCIVTVGMLCSCGNTGVGIGIRDFNADNLIGTWELTSREMITQKKGKKAEKEKIFPGTKQYASELTFYHDGEYVNKYDNERTDSGKWEKSYRLLSMTSFNSVKWGLVNVYKVNKTQLIIKYVISTDINEEKIYLYDSSWLNDFDGYNAVVYSDVYKRIDD
jgi:hypothetical protein